MAQKNWLWGAEKIQGELLRLGIKVSKRTFQKYWKKVHVMEHETRKIVHTAVTTHPTDDWTAQKLKEVTPWNKRPKYLIRDNSSKFGKRFSSVAENSGIQELKTPFQASKANVPAND